MEELISIIIPVYKVEKYLNKCVQSVVSQTYRKLEIILVDDGSPDRCGEMCDAWAEKDKRIRVIHKENGGLSSARNAGIDASTGEYLMFIDSDDYIAPEMAEKLLLAKNKYGADIVSCSIARVDEQGSILSEFKIIETMLTGEDCLRNCVVEKELATYSVNKVYSRFLFETLRFPEKKLYEDKFLLQHIYTKCKRVYHIPDILYFYLKRNDSISRSGSSVLKLHWTEALLDCMNLCVALEKHEYAGQGMFCFGLLLSELSNSEELIRDNRESLNNLHQGFKELFYLRRYCSAKEKIHLWLIFISPKLHCFLVKLAHHHPTHTENHP